MNDESLLFYHYGDGLTASERALVEAELRRDPALAQRYQELRAELALFPTPGPVRASEGARRRWANELDRLAAGDARPAPRPRVRLGWQLAGGFALLLLGAVTGLRITQLKPPEQHIEIAEHVEVDLRPLVRAVQAHLDLTGTRLAQLPGADLTGRRALLTDIIEQNRLYQRSAEHQNADKLARVLRAIEPVLISLGNDEEDPEAFDASLRQLEFELTVMQTKLAKDPSKALTRS